MSVSNLRIMLALMAKDWRLFRLPVLALVIAGVGCYLLTAVASLSARETDRFVDWLFISCDLAVNLSAVLAAAFGGMAIAGERSAKTSDFLGVLPVTRVQIVLSKWIVSASVLIFVMAVHLCVGLSIYFSHHLRIWPYEWPTWNPTWVSADFIRIATWYAMVWCIGMTTCLFGVAWLFGTFLRSAAISASCSIAFTIGALIFWTTQIHAKGKEPLCYGSLGMAVGMCCLVAGTAYYLKRIEP